METIYLETSVISYLAAPISRDQVTAAKQKVTHDWWDSSRQRYELFVSDVVEQEVGNGDERLAQARLLLIKGIVRFSVTAEIDTLAEAFLQGSSLPPHALADAVHIAVATVNALDFLLTWNCRHIANPHMLRKLTEIAQTEGYVLPVVCTPMELQASENSP